MTWRCIALLVATFIVSSTALAAELRPVTITYLKGQTLVTATIQCMGKVPGQTKRGVFTSLKKQISAYRSAGGGGARLRNLKAMQAAGKAKCASPVTPGINGNFDGFGNVTPAGKIAFEIPLHLSATISGGRAVYESMCSECHGERLNYHFPILRTRTALEPMFFSIEELTDQDVADLTAFFNRFNP